MQTEEKHTFDCHGRVTSVPKQQTRVKFMMRDTKNFTKCPQASQRKSGIHFRRFKIYDFKELSEYVRRVMEMEGVQETHPKMEYFDGTDWIRFDSQGEFEEGKTVTMENAQFSPLGPVMMVRTQLAWEPETRKRDFCVFGRGHRRSPLRNRQTHHPRHAHHSIRSQQKRNLRQNQLSNRTNRFWKPRKNLSTRIGRRLKRAGRLFRQRHPPQILTVQRPRTGRCKARLRTPPTKAEKLECKMENSNISENVWPEEEDLTHMKLPTVEITELDWPEAPLPTPISPSVKSFTPELTVEDISSDLSGDDWEMIQSNMFDSISSDLIVKPVEKTNEQEVVEQEVQSETSEFDVEPKIVSKESKIASKYPENMEMLKQMGFEDFKLNEHFLNHHKGNLQNTVEALLKLTMEL